MEEADKTRFSKFFEYSSYNDIMFFVFQFPWQDIRLNESC